MNELTHLMCLWHQFYKSSLLICQK